MNEKECIEISDYLLKSLFPICRSITGNGVRETFRILGEFIDFNIKEYPTGLQCFDWKIPKEWNIKDAYIKDPDGNKIVDFQKSNIHVVNYSEAVHKKIGFDELKKKIYTLPDLPDAIPYRTSYYNKKWGFCMAHKDFLNLKQEGEYEVLIDSSLENGSLTLGECSIQGESKEEILVSSYCCHPSMVNDNLSGPIVQALLYRELKKRKKLKYSYRFVLVPETIGPIVYLSQHQEIVNNIVGGFVLTTCGGPGDFGVKRSFLGNHIVDKAVLETFREYGISFINYDFRPDGSDERQYSSPGFRIPVCTISKDKYYEYDYYHTSLDNLDFVPPENLLKTLKLYLSAIDKIESNEKYLSLSPYGEVQLGKRGLYPQTGGGQHQSALGSEHQEEDFFIKYIDEVDAICWFLFLADGSNSLFDMAERSKVPFEQLKEIANKLIDKKLITKVEM